jgi:hypothetical protein
MMQKKKISFFFLFLFLGLDFGRRTTNKVWVSCNQKS